MVPQVSMVYINKRKKKKNGSGFLVESMWLVVVDVRIREFIIIDFLSIFKFL